MTYEETLQFLYVRHTSVYRGLERIRYLLEKLGNPQDAFPAVLITGTNGKGSTAKIISRILREAGYRTGCFTSPHLVDFGERITINGEYIPQDQVVSLAEEIISGPLAQFEQEQAQLQIEGIVSFFEIVTALGFLYFARQHVDIAVLEVGIGGRLDATNTSNPLISVIMPIGLEHQDLLGDTIAKIATEKADIIRAGRAVVISRQTPEALAVIEETCRARRARLFQTGVSQAFKGKFFIGQHPPAPLKGGLSGSGASHEQSERLYAKSPLEGGRGVLSDKKLTLERVSHEDAEFPIYSLPQTISATGSVFSYHGIRNHFVDLHLPLLGKHQIANATAALAVIEILNARGFQTDEETIRAGLAKVIHPGRLEVFRTTPPIVLDIAHDFSGASVTAEALTSVFEYDKLILVIGVLGDKNVQDILRPFLQIADSLIFTSPHNTPRTKAAAETANVAEQAIALGLITRTVPRHGGEKVTHPSQYAHWLIYESVPEAIQQAQTIASKKDLICITGSNYTVAEAELYLKR